MAGPTDLEQLLLELINNARLDPMGDAARYITSYTPLVSNNSDIQVQLNGFNVSGSALQSAFQALTPVQPFAWNENLANAARGHNNAMIAADQQSHQVPGEPDFVQRAANAGYTNFSVLSDNVFGRASSVILGHASFMVDWGPGPNGMQNPPGHRNSIMDEHLREAGIGITPENNSSTSLGPLVITEDFGARFDSGAFILGVAYNDTDHNAFYSAGEGLGTLNVSLGAASVTSFASGGYTLQTSATGTQNITLSGAGLAGPLTVAVNLAANSNIKLDVIDGHVLAASASVAVSGASADIAGLGVTGLSLQSVGSTSRTLTGTPGGDTLIGDAGNDTLRGAGSGDLLNGGAGTDTADYAASAAAVTVNLTTNSNSGGDAASDVLQNVENLIGSVFADNLTGDANNNVLTGGLGGDLLDGGAGVDTANYSASSAAVTVNLATNANSGGEARFDLLLNIENLIGSALADELTGDANSNVLAGGLSGDLLDGGAGVDTANYSASSAAVTVNLATNANSGGDARFDLLLNVENLIGSTLADELTGNANSNVLAGGLSGDLLDGGAGVDTADYSASSAAVTVNLATNANSGGDARFDLLQNIENVMGSGFADALTGDASGNVLQGGSGNDTLNGGVSGDLLDGGAGTDTADYSTSSAPVTVGLATNANSGGDARFDLLLNVENLIGSTLADELTGDANSNVLAGGLSGDLLDGGAGVDTADYSASSAAVTVNLATNANSGGDARFDLLQNIENLAGSGFADALTGDAGGNVLQGDAGDDTLTGGAGGDLLDGGAGTDTADYSASSEAVTVNIFTGANSGGDARFEVLQGIENLVGSAFADSLTGDLNGNVLQGGSGNDTLNGGISGDLLDGGAGTDTADYSTSSAPVTVSLATNANSGGDARFDLLLNVENLIGSTLADELTGDANSNVLAGGLSGDLLDGGAGVDTADYSASSAAVTVNLATNANSGGDARFDLLQNIENVMGSGFADALTGDASGNVLQGGSGNDTLNGGISGDLLDGGAGTDTADYSTSSAPVTVSLATNANSGGDARFDLLLNVENLIGSTLADELTGDANSNVLAGGLSGDLLDGGAGVDTADYSASSAAVTVNLATNANSGGDARFDLLQNIENVMGSGFADALTGDASGNVLQGGSGNDTLNGGISGDLLDGGAGTDTADYSTSSAPVTVSLASNANSGGDARFDLLQNIENLIGSGFADNLTGDANSNVLTGGGSGDAMSGGAAADTFYYGALSDSGNGGDVVSDFTTGAGGDVLDLHQILASFSGYNGTNAFSGGYLQFTASGADTMVMLDSDGGANSLITLVLLTNAHLVQADIANYLL